MVICRGERKEDGTKGDYQLATHRVWKNKVAAVRWANGVSDSRDPIVVEVMGSLEFTVIK